MSFQSFHFTNYFFTEIKMAARRSKEELIQELEAKILKLKEKALTKNEVKITIVSVGISEAVSAIENAAAQNTISISEVIKVISRIKRTGLRIEDSVRKS
jgi:hypothetical protein